MPDRKKTFEDHLADGQALLREERPGRPPPDVPVVALPCALCGLDPYTREPNMHGRAKVWCFGKYGSNPGHEITITSPTLNSAIRNWNKLHARGESTGAGRGVKGGGDNG